MLFNIDSLLGPELLKILRGMGHGDEIAIVDANYPAESDAQRLVRLDGVSATRVLQAVVSLMPLDAYVDAPVHTMQVVGDPNAVPDIVVEFRDIVNASPSGKVNSDTLERFAFYERVKAAYAVVSTGEERLYGNIILKKGVIPPS
jgi:L-fucose mutarotase